jgi:hypothetical protein
MDNGPFSATLSFEIHVVFQVGRTNSKRFLYVDRFPRGTSPYRLKKVSWACGFHCETDTKRAAHKVKSGRDPHSVMQLDNNRGAAVGVVVGTRRAIPIVHQNR